MVHLGGFFEAKTVALFAITGDIIDFVETAWVL